MRTARFLLGLLAVTAFQILGQKLFPQFFELVDLFLVLVVYNALVVGPVGSMAGGSVAGLAHDALTGGLFGLFGFADTLVGWAAARLRQRLVVRQPAQVAMLFALAAAVQQLAVVVVTVLMLPSSDFPSPSTMVVRMVTTAGIGTLVFVVAGRSQLYYARWKQNRHKRLRIDL